MSRSRDALFDPEGVRWQRVSQRNLIRARHITLAIWLGTAFVVALGLAIGLRQWWIYLIAGVLAALGLWGWWLIPRQVRAIGYAERSDDLLIRTGIMFRTLVVVPYGRMQYVDVNVGPLDRALNLATVQLHTASASTDASIAGLEPGEAARLRDRLASRGEARLAGL